MQDPRILVVGSANVDLVTRVPRCPKPGETLLGHSFATIPGGKGANQAVATARLGAATYFAGCVGDDTFGEMQRRTLAADGIDLTYLKIHRSEPTGTAVIFVADEGQNSIVVTPSANHGITPDDVAAMEGLFANLDAVLLQLEIPLETVEATLELARSHGVLSILDAGPAQRVPAAILQKADVVSPNETEAEAMTGVAVHDLASAKEAARQLRDMGTREVVMKLGAAGSFYLGEEVYHTAPFAVTPVDTVAAGDAFTAALALKWRALCPHNAMRFANAAGALTTTVAGAQPSMPTRQAVERFLSEKGVEL